MSLEDSPLPPSASTPLSLCHHPDLRLNEHSWQWEVLRLDLVKDLPVEVESF